MPIPVEAERLCWRCSYCTTYKFSRILAPLFNPFGPTPCTSASPICIETPGSPPKQSSLSRLTSGRYLTHSQGENNIRRAVWSGRGGSKRVTRSSLGIVGKTQSINSLGGFKVHDTQSSSGSSDDSDYSEDGRYARERNGRWSSGWETGGRGKEVGLS